MASYRVRLTRIVRESIIVEVEGWNVRDARNVARNRHREGQVQWDNADTRVSDHVRVEVMP